MTTKQELGVSLEKLIFMLDVADLKSGATTTTNNIALVTLPKGQVATHAVIRTTDPAVGASVTAFTVQLKAGSSGLHTAASIFTAINASVPLTSTGYPDHTSDSGTAITLACVSTGANISVLTAGAVEVTLYVAH